ncbi:MAG: hypothetical protein H6R22_825 [Chromatiaceae bacterium]|nr:hypothetical protein [Chromatiaceae bacterium]
MMTRKSLAVVAILSLIVSVGLIVSVAAWSKLRFVDDEDFAPQRWKLGEHPAFRSGG